MNIELKPCPFCGGKEAYICGNYGSSQMYIRCNACGSQTGYNYQNKAIELWNTRIK